MKDFSNSSATNPRQQEDGRKDYKFLEAVINKSTPIQSNSPSFFSANKHPKLNKSNSNPTIYNLPAVATSKPTKTKTIPPLVTHQYKPLSLIVFKLIRLSLAPIQQKIPEKHIQLVSIQVLQNSHCRSPSSGGRQDKADAHHKQDQTSHR